MPLIARLGLQKNHLDAGAMAHQRGHGNQNGEMEMVMATGSVHGSSS